MTWLFFTSRSSSANSAYWNDGAGSSSTSSVRVYLAAATLG